MNRLTEKTKPNPIYDCNYISLIEEKGLLDKLGQLEDIEERLSKYKEIGINGLIDLFENLTDEDIEYIVQLSFKKRKVIYDIQGGF